ELPTAHCPLPTADVRPHRFLVCWFAAYLVFFSLVSTKLPNYVLPLYPAVAILTARFLVRWRDDALSVPRWLMPAAAGGMLLVAAAVGLGLLVAGGAVPVLPAAARGGTRGPAATTGSSRAWCSTPAGRWPSSARPRSAPRSWRCRRRATCSCPSRRGGGGSPTR